MPVTYADPSRAPLETEWVWQDRLPRGAVVLLAGWRQSAKGLLACNLAAAVTTGAPLPGETARREPGSVVMVLPEDDPQEDVPWRLRAAGADRARIHDLTTFDDGSPFELSAVAGDEGSVPTLEVYLRWLTKKGQNPRLVILDPLNALVTKGTIKTDAGARRVIASLTRVARRTGVCILVVHHFVKSTRSIGGSTGLVDAPRWVYAIEPTGDRLTKTLHLEKHNAGPADDLRYRILEDGHNSRIEWVDPVQAAREEQSWRQAPPSAQANPAALGCRHPRTRYGTWRQCPDCPARGLKAAPVPARTPRPAPIPAMPPMPRAAPRSTTRARPATVPAAALFAAMRATTGPSGQAVTTSIGGPWEDLEEAQAACHADAGRPLAWTRKGSDLWVARVPTLAGQVATTYGISNRS